MGTVGSTALTDPSAPAAEDGLRRVAEGRVWPLSGGSLPNSVNGLSGSGQVGPIRVRSEWRPPFTPAHVCVMTPRVEAAGPDGLARAVVPLARPTIFAQGTFDGIQILKQAKVVWSLEPGEDGPLHGPIPWPLDPIRPEETFMLLLRPSGATEAEAAAIELKGASAETLRRSSALLRQLGEDATAWLRAVRESMEGGDLALAAALLFAFEGPSSPELDALRREVFLQGCGPEPEAWGALRWVPISLAAGGRAGSPRS